jgi:hypothetical protein
MPRGQLSSSILASVSSLIVFGRMTKYSAEIASTSSPAMAGAGRSIALSMGFVEAALTALRRTRPSAGRRSASR